MGTSHESRTAGSRERSTREACGHCSFDEKSQRRASGDRQDAGGAAAALGLADRGLLREGQAADVVLFDPATIIDRSTYDDPHQYPAGMGAVSVNGTVVIDGGEHTSALPGRLLRRRGTVLA